MKPKYPSNLFTLEPAKASYRRLAITQSKAKMNEFSVEASLQEIDIGEADPHDLFYLAIGILGEYAYNYSNLEQINFNANEYKSRLRFVADFFDSFVDSNLDETINDYLLILGASAFYLNDLAGSSVVLINKLLGKSSNIENAYESYIIWLLSNRNANFAVELNIDELLHDIFQTLNDFLNQGIKVDVIKDKLKSLSNSITNSTNPRDVLLVDILIAVTLKKIENSTWNNLPKYSGVEVDKWSSVLSRQNFIKELWPSQKLLGENNVFKGASAVIQMPTSAGKSKSTELIIRSFFLRNERGLVVMVAPFNSLCNELRNELIQAFDGDGIEVEKASDVLNFDLVLDEFMGEKSKKILIITPEKLVQLIKGGPDLIRQVGLIIIDEGHQFDSGSRGITFELLLTILKRLINENTQKIIISAVVSNANDIAKWFIGDESRVISSNQMQLTRKTMSFTRWVEKLGQMVYVNPLNINEDEFFVPRIIVQERLKPKPRETTEKDFPTKNDDDKQSVAIYLSLKLLKNGSVALFCGNKKSPNTILEKMLDLYERGYSLPQPSSYADSQEIIKLSNLARQNLGEHSITSKGFLLGVATHHSRVPQGVRLCVEHAVRLELIKLVVCTSTLAQGVNLPIRYLILTSIYQAGQELKVRDFQNLIGRAGRSGMYTEGSIIFADKEVYNLKKSNKERWSSYEKLVNPNNSEPCISMIDKLFEPLNIYGLTEFRDFHLINFYKKVLADPVYYQEFLSKLKLSVDKKRFEDIKKDLSFRFKLIASIQSFMISSIKFDTEIIDVSSFTKDTFGYFLLDKDEDKKKLKSSLVELFEIIAENIKNELPTSAQQQQYSKVLFGIGETKKISKWLEHNKELLIESLSHIELFKTLWDLLKDFTETNLVNKCSTPELIQELGCRWISNESYAQLFGLIEEKKAVIQNPQRTSNYVVEDVVEICEQEFAFKISMVLGAISQLLSFESIKEKQLNDKVIFLQKSLRYGLDTEETICIFELGFADRVVSSEINKIIDYKFGNDIYKCKKLIRKKYQTILLCLKDYPHYFTYVLKRFK